MLVKMTRTQCTAFGMLHSGVAYNLDPKTPDQEKSLKLLIERKFAVKTAAKKLEAAKASAEEVSRAGQDAAAQAADVGAKAKAKADADAKAKADSDAKAKADADAKAKA